MLNTLKGTLRRGIATGVSVVGRTRGGRLLFGEIRDAAQDRTKTVLHGAIDLRFSVPNRINEYRADSFSTKEPETLAWIDGFEKGSVLWDIGANVGIYSCYAAKSRSCSVVAFEPSVFNLELLARNVFLNGLVEQVTIVAIPLCEARQASTLNMSSTDSGGALSTFGSDIGHDGQPLRQVFRFRTVGLSMHEASVALGLPLPDYIKIDVDGIEHLILAGGGPVLVHAREVLVEIDDTFAHQVETVRRTLEQAGFLHHAKLHAEFLDRDSGPGRHVYNHIWVRR